MIRSQGTSPIPTGWLARLCGLDKPRRRTYTAEARLEECLARWRAETLDVAAFETEGRS